jgi:hypothetical protein
MRIATPLRGTPRPRRKRPSPRGASTQRLRVGLFRRDRGFSQVMSPPPSLSLSVETFWAGARIFPGLYLRTHGFCLLAWKGCSHGVGVASESAFTALVIPLKNGDIVFVLTEYK